MKRSLCILLSALICLCAVSLTGCGNEEKTTETTGTTASTASTTSASNGSDLNLESFGIKPDITYSDKEYGFQLEKPEKGDTVAIIHTNMGDISLTLFPEECPKTVKNFIELAKAGKYDNVIFHRVIENFMIQGGDYENQNGTGGKSYEGGQFEDEFCDKLLNLTGSIAMANSGSDTNGSQFFINYAEPKGFSENEAQWSQVKAQFNQYKGTDAYSSMVNYYTQQYYTALYNTDLVDYKVKELYEEHGGNPTLDGAYNLGDRGHTVFGQVYDGLEVVEKISKVATNDNDKPEKDVIIKNIEITEYK